MKRFLLAFSLVTVLSFNHNSSDVSAQRLSVSINIGNQPAWGPVGYDYAAYYYLPDIDVYYDVNRSNFYYWDRGAWRSSRYLPYSYGQYDLYGMYKVVINQPDPWLYNDRYRREYGRYRGNRSQVIILNSPDRRYDRVRYNRVDWVNPNNRPGRYPNYHNQYGGYNGRPGYNNGRPDNGRPNHNNNSRPDNNRPNYNGNGGNNSRPDNNRPNYNGNGGNNSRPDNGRPNHNNNGGNNGRPDNNRPNYNGNGGNNSRPDNNSGNNTSRRSSRSNASSKSDQMKTSSSENQSGRRSNRSTQN